MISKINTSSGYILIIKWVHTHQTSPPALSALDIQGMSHRAGPTMDRFHTVK